MLITYSDAIMKYSNKIIYCCRKCLTITVNFSSFILQCLVTQLAVLITMSLSTFLFIGNFKASADTGVRSARIIAISESILIIE